VFGSLFQLGQLGAFPSGRRALGRFRQADAEYPTDEDAGSKRVRAQTLCRPALAVDLGRDLVDDRVHSASCSLDGAVRDILRCDHSALRHVPGRADRSCLNAAYCNGETEHD